MKTETPMPETQDAFVPISLHDLVNRVSDCLAPASQGNKNLIINHVPKSIYSEINENLVTPILTSLLNVVIMHTENSRIRITGKLFGNVVLLHVKDDGCLNYDSISHLLAEIQVQAEKMGGFVGFTSYRNKLTTIAFSFTNYERCSQKAVRLPG